LVAKERIFKNLFKYEFKRENKFFLDGRKIVILLANSHFNTKKQQIQIKIAI
jgi:hypothetical protein